jgi:hypothetical protein
LALLEYHVVTENAVLPVQLFRPQFSRLHLQRFSIEEALDLAPELLALEDGLLGDLVLSRSASYSGLLDSFGDGADNLPSLLLVYAPELSVVSDALLQLVTGVFLLAGVVKLAGEGIIGEEYYLSGEIFGDAVILVLLPFVLGQL